MSIASGTLSINPAFFQEIKEENRQLSDLMGHCRELFEPPLRNIRWQRRVSMLRQLRDQLAMHFALEDAYGYFEDAIDVAPRLAEDAEQLRQEHSDLYLEISGLVDFAEQALYHESTDCTAESLSERFLAFHQRFTDHEARENRLILSAFDDDIGVGD